MRFTYEGPYDATDVTLVGVKKGSSIDVPDEVAAGFFAQSETWSPDKQALASLTVPALEARAETLGVDVPSGAKKGDVVSALVAHSTNPRDTTTEEA